MCFGNVRGFGPVQPKNFAFRYLPAVRDFSIPRNRKLLDHLKSRLDSESNDFESSESTVNADSKDNGKSKAVANFMNEFGTRLADDESWHNSRVLPDQFKNLPAYLRQVKSELTDATPLHLFGAFCLHHFDSAFPMPFNKIDLHSHMMTATFLPAVPHPSVEFLSFKHREWWNDCGRQLARGARHFERRPSSLFELRLAVQRGLTGDDGNAAAEWFGVDVLMTKAAHRNITSSPAFQNKIAPTIFRAFKDGGQEMKPVDFVNPCANNFFENATFPAATCLREGGSIVVDAVDFHEHDLPDDVVTPEQQKAWLIQDEVSLQGIRYCNHRNIGFFRAICRALGIYKDTVKYLLSAKGLDDFCETRRDRYSSEEFRALKNEYADTLNATVRHALHLHHDLPKIDEKNVGWFHDQRLTIVVDGMDRCPGEIERCFQLGSCLDDFRNFLFDACGVGPNPGPVHQFSGRMELQRIVTCAVSSEKRRDPEYIWRHNNAWWYYAEEGKEANKAPSDEATETKK